MRSRLSSRKSDRVAVSVDAIASIFLKMRSLLCVIECDRVYLTLRAIAILTNQPSSNGFNILNPSMRRKSSTLRVTKLQPSAKAQAAIKESANLTR